MTEPTEMAAFDEDAMRAPVITVSPANEAGVKAVGHPSESVDLQFIGLTARSRMRS